MTAICVDVMGSDKGPEVVLEGVAQALAADSDLTVLVAGADEYVTPFCEKHEGARPLVTTEVIHMDEHSGSLRHRPHQGHQAPGARIAVSRRRRPQDRDARPWRER